MELQPKTAQRRWDGRAGGPVAVTQGGDEPPAPLSPSHLPSDSNECFQVHEGGCSVWGLCPPVPFPVPGSSLTALGVSMSAALGVLGCICFLLAAKLHEQTECVSEIKFKRSLRDATHA